MEANRNFPWKLFNKERNMLRTKGGDDARLQSLLDYWQRTPALIIASDWCTALSFMHLLGTVEGFSVPTEP